MFNVSPVADILRGNESIQHSEAKAYFIRLEEQIAISWNKVYYESPEAEDASNQQQQQPLKSQIIWEYISVIDSTSMSPISKFLKKHNRVQERQLCSDDLGRATALLNQRQPNAHLKKKHTQK